jgi:REP element-mobilizing transposase RayT
MLRGNAREDVFCEVEDHHAFCHLLEEGVARFGHRIVAFCLMSNHVHLAIQVAETPLSRILQNLSFRYTQWFNRRHRRVGHLFQGRYKALLVDSDRYLLGLVRYIHRNPVAAGLVRLPAAYSWSSHRAYVGRTSIPWLETAWVLSRFSQRRSSARQQFDQFVRKANGGDREGAYWVANERVGDLVGSKQFQHKLERQLSRARLSPSKPTLDGLVRHVCQAYGLSEETLAAPGKERVAAEARAVLAHLVRESPGLSLDAAVNRCGRAASSLSAAATRHAARGWSDRAREFINRVRSQSQMP